MHRSYGILIACASLLVIGSVDASARAPAVGTAAPVSLQPEKVARVFPDGTRGPWQDVTGGDVRTGDEPFAAIWDSFELDPRNYNRQANIPDEYYDVPPGSGQYCLELPGSRLFWCDPNQQGCQPLPSCVSATGGDLAADPPDRAMIVSYLWGALGNGDRLQVELQFFDTYDGDDCSDAGSNMIGGLVSYFLPPARGQYHTTVDLSRFGLDFDTPQTGRIGIRMIMWTDRDNGLHSDQAYPLLWLTKSDWAHAMGQTDENGFSDAHGDGNCELDGNPDECVRGEPACPNGDSPVGPAVLLLGEGEFGNCQYTLKRDAKAKKRCTGCPEKGDVFDTSDQCVDKFDCRVKLSVKRIDCPDGGAGFCKSIKGKRLDCRR